MNETLILTVIVSLLLIVSEILGLVETIKPNGIIDAVRLGLIEIIKFIEARYPNATPS